MHIIAHRGFWRNHNEKNTKKAFERALSCGYGIETDIRDWNGKLVVSHDMPQGNAMLLDELLELYHTSSSKSCLALNIKADGLQNDLNKLLSMYGIEHYFVFDMSVPDTLGYLKAGLQTFSRCSEYEQELPFYEKCSGLWVDGFESDWAECRFLEKPLAEGKSVCVVSPELHGRDYKHAWERYRDISDQKFMICTDYPHKAEEYFSKFQSI